MGVSCPKAYWDEAGHIYEWRGHGGFKEQRDHVCPLLGRFCLPGSLHCGQLGKGWPLISSEIKSSMQFSPFLLLYLSLLVLFIIIEYFIIYSFIIYPHVSLFITVLLATIPKIEKKKKKAPPRRPNQQISESFPLIGCLQPWTTSLWLCCKVSLTKFYKDNIFSPEKGKWRDCEGLSLLFNIICL